MDSPVSSLRQAVPYLRHYRGDTFVVKVGGEAIAKSGARRALLEQIAVLAHVGIQVVLVHGGGPQATELGERLGASSEFVDGRRVTDAAMLEAMILALNGQVRTELLADAAALGLPAVGLSGIDGGMVRAARRPPRDGIDYGWVGDLEGVDPRPLQAALQSGFTPFVSPLCANSAGQPLNVNADTVAAHIAIALQAAKIVFVTGERGILRDPADPTSLISQLSISELRQLESEGALGGGMLPKAACIALALEGGVRRAHVIGFQFPDSLLTEIFTNEGCGTLIEGGGPPE